MKKSIITIISVCFAAQPAAADIWSKARDHLPITPPGTHLPLPLPRKELPDPIPMASYCVTYTDMKGPDDAEGRNRVRYETIHVRGGRDVAKTIAYGKHGEKNVRSIDNKPCSEVYAQR